MPNHLPLMSRILGIIITSLLFCFLESAKAEGTSLIINGKSFHKENPKSTRYNERNWGLGLQYDFKTYNDHWAPYITVSALRDSFKRNSYYAGGGLMRRFSLAKIHDELHFDAGLIGFVMVRKDHHNRKPFLGALPAFSLGTEKLAVNISYIPEVEPKLAPLWFLQLKVSFGIFQ